MTDTKPLTPREAFDARGFVLDMELDSPRPRHPMYTIPGEDPGLASATYGWDGRIHARAREDVHLTEKACAIEALGAMFSVWVPIGTEVTPRLAEEAGAAWVAAFKGWLETDTGPTDD